MNRTAVRPMPYTYVMGLELDDFLDDDSGAVQEPAEREAEVVKLPALSDSERVDAVASFGRLDYAHFAPYTPPPPSQYTIDNTAGALAARADKAAGREFDWGEFYAASEEYGFAYMSTWGQP